MNDYCRFLRQLVLTLSELPVIVCPRCFVTTFVRLRGDSVASKPLCDGTIVVGVRNDNEPMPDELGIRPFALSLVKHDS